VPKLNNQNFSDKKIFSFATGVNDQRNRWCTFSCEYLRDFSKKIERALIGYSGDWGKLIMKKTLNQKSRGTVT
jgi:hypothetical protein